jgi:hypothetical protein
MLITTTLSVHLRVSPASHDVEVECEDIQEDEHEGMQGAKEDEVLQLGKETSGQVCELTFRRSSTYSKSATLTLS